MPQVEVTWPVVGFSVVGVGLVVSGYPVAQRLRILQTMRICVRGKHSVFVT